MLSKSPKIQQKVTTNYPNQLNVCKICQIFSQISSKNIGVNEKPKTFPNFQQIFEKISLKVTKVTKIQQIIAKNPTVIVIFA